MITPYAASPGLESLVLHMAPPYKAVCDAPDSWSALQAWHGAAKYGERIPVYDGGSEKTIYSQAQYNYSFRAWHDKIHLDLGLSFSKVDEIKVSNEHVRQAKARRVMFNITSDDIRALRYDVAGQVLYYYKYNEFVRDQALFVGACMKTDLFTVLNSGTHF